MKEKKVINEHKFVILVPLSEDAQERMNLYDIYDNGEIADCFNSMVFDLETEEYMEVRLFDLINAELGTLINIYEEEYVVNKDVKRALELTKRLTEISDDKKFIEFATEFMNILTTAIECKTDVGFYF